jgi:hypothetical protein
LQKIAADAIAAEPGQNEHIGTRTEVMVVKNTKTRTKRQPAEYDNGSAADRTNQQCHQTNTVLSE